MSESSRSLRERLEATTEELDAATHDLEEVRKEIRRTKPPAAPSRARGIGALFAAGGAAALAFVAYGIARTPPPLERTADEPIQHPSSPRWLFDANPRPEPELAPRDAYPQLRSFCESVTLERADEWLVAWTHVGVAACTVEDRGFARRVVRRLLQEPRHPHRGSALTCIARACSAHGIDLLEWPRSSQRDE